jgi:isoleucyl-tRNA synthetase
VLGPDELLVEPRERPGYALVREGDLAVALNTELDEELIDEGLVRELVHAVQNLRREREFEIEETISVTLGGSPRIVSLLRGPGETTSRPRCSPGS